MTKNYAIARIKKYSRVGQVGYLVNHHLRYVEVANADPKIKNEVLHQVEDVKQFLEDIPKGSKKNAVRFIDCLLLQAGLRTKDNWSNGKKRQWILSEKPTEQKI